MMMTSDRADCPTLRYLAEAAARKRSRPTVMVADHECHFEVGMFGEPTVPGGQTLWRPRGPVVPQVT
jgi:hypothetical protein